MPLESWLKIAMPAFPIGFTLVGTCLYWKENPLPLLAPPIAFWGLMICYYLFGTLYVPQRRYPLVMMMIATLLWLVASLTSHSLAEFLHSDCYRGPLSLIRRTDFWYAYICAAGSLFGGLKNFLEYEPQILAQVRLNRAAADEARDGGG